MFAAFGLGLLGMMLWQGTEPPDIGGQWRGEEWGEVALEKKRDGEYEGTYTDTFKTTPGTIQVKWSRLETRFKGTWREGDDRYGKISLRLVGVEVRGAWTTHEKSGINPGTPELADLLWKRSSGKTSELQTYPDPVAAKIPALDAKTNTSPVRKWALDRHNARSVVETYVTAALAGDTATAATLAKDRSADSKQTAEFFGSLNIKSLAMKSVYVSDPAHATTALAISESVKLKSKQPDGQRDGFLVLTLTKGNEGWFITDIDFESEDGADEELAKFIEANPKSIGLPPFFEKIPPEGGTSNKLLGAAEDKAPAPQRVLQYQPDRRVKQLACSADGKLIVVANDYAVFPASNDWKRTVKVLDSSTGKVNGGLQVLSREEYSVLAATKGVRKFEVEAIALSADGSLVAVGTGLGQCKLFEARTGEPIRSLNDEGPRPAGEEIPENLKRLARAMGSVSSLAFSPDGSLLAMCGGSFEDVPLVSEPIETQTRVLGLGRKATAPGRLKIWEVKSGTLKHDLVGHSDATAVAFSPDGKLLASAGRWGGDRDNGTGVILWNPQSGEKIRTLETGANGGTYAVAFSLDSKLVAIGSRSFDKDKAEDSGSGVVSLVHVATGILEWKQTVPNSAQPVAFSPDGKSVAVLCGSRSLRVLDIATGSMNLERFSNAPEGGPWSDFTFAAQGSKLIMGGAAKERKGNVEMWDLPGKQ